MSGQGCMKNYPISVKSQCLMALFVLPFFCFATGGKSIRYEDYIYEENVRTVQFYKNNDELSFPFFRMSEKGQLVLEFDVLSAPDESFETFWITFENCDASWNPSNVFVVEFLNALSRERIDQYSQSNNTAVPFKHYKIIYPVNAGTFKLSGNFILKVFRDGDESDLIITRRFLVSEDRIGIVPDIGLSMNPGQRYTVQQVNFRINFQGSPFNNPFREMKVVVLQNMRWDNAITQLQPQFMTQDFAEYNFNSNNSFPGGNEFRKLDIRSLRTNSFGMGRVMHDDAGWSVSVTPEKPRKGTSYFTNGDFNGSFYIKTTDFNDPVLDAQYVNCLFTLETPAPYKEGPVYFYGKITDWSIKNRYEMVWNAGTSRYEGNFLLKQGIYDYEYVLYNAKKRNVDEAAIEGSFYETENYYTILVYMMGITDRTQRLIGVKHLNYYD